MGLLSGSTKPIMHNMTRILLLMGLLPLVLVAASTAVKAQPVTPAIEILRVEGTIVPIIASYIDRGISRAENTNADLLIIELNTPGGLMDSTEQIVGRIMNARIPVVVYVTPKGAWAASAGTFITLSAHIAAMTPGTTIGAAHPVTTGGQQLPEDQMQKITEFSAKWMKTIAEERKRNIDEAQLAVTESKSFSDVDALRLNLIDIRANSLNDLIAQINGRKVILADGREITIDTTGYETTRNEMSAIERFLHAISNPNIAYVLLSIGSIGIIAEIYNPGSFFPGIIGAISLLMAFYSLGVLDANIGGLLLILLAFGLFIAEVFTSGFGILAGGGIASLALGSILLFPERGPLFQVNPWLVGTVVVLISAFFIFVISRIIRAHRGQVSTGWEELVGKTATVEVALAPEGMVLFRGERWKAVSESGTVDPGETVIIKKVDGLKLSVTKKQ